MFTAGSPEAEIERRSKVLVMPAEGRGQISYVILTNDRILFSRQLFASPGEGGLAALVAEGAIQRVYDKKSKGPAELLALGDVRGAKKIRRPLRGDVWEFTLADGTTCSLGASAAKHWDSQIRRLVSERHGRTVVDDGDGAWRVQG